MKKKLLVCLLVSVMALSFAVPAMAATITEPESVNAVVDYEGIAPRNEMTRFYWRTYNGILQFRVWSITNGRWINDWTNVYFI